MILSNTFFSGLHEIYTTWGRIGSCNPGSGGTEEPAYFRRNQIKFVVRGMVKIVINRRRAFLDAVDDFPSELLADNDGIAVRVAVFDQILQIRKSNFIIFLIGQDIDDFTLQGFSILNVSYHALMPAPYFA